MPPIVSIVGKSGSGKTTFLEKLIRELKSRGYRVATIKHSHHSFTLDKPTKDSRRHIEAGSDATIVSSTSEIAVLIPIHKELSTEETARMLGEDYDIILTEGFSLGDAPKIEVHRKEVGTPLRSARKRIAIVTDEPLEMKIRQFALDDIKGVADLLETGFIKPQMERISFYVNDVHVPLSIFPRQIITNILEGMASSLKGVDRVKTIQIFMKKKTE